MLLLSIKPRYARMILRGSKTVELRRRAPRCSADFWLALYATTPVRAVVGIVLARKVDVASPEALWEYAWDASGLDQDEYRRYYMERTAPSGFGSRRRLDRALWGWTTSASRGPIFGHPAASPTSPKNKCVAVGDCAGMCCIRGEAD